VAELATGVFGVVLIFIVGPWLAWQRRYRPALVAVVLGLLVALFAVWAADRLDSEDDPAVESTQPTPIPEDA
jgi:hypothetical protein